MWEYKGVVISEGLRDPIIINEFPVYKAEITGDDRLIDYDGHLGRWHIFYIECNKSDIDRIQSQLLQGWYTHFWKGNHIIVVYNDRQFQMLKDDKSTWEEAIEHGKAQGIPLEELDFPTD